LNILFITANRLGDAVLSTGLLGALIDRHPGAHVTVACGPLAQSLFAPIPQVVRVIAMEKRPLHGHWRALWLQTIGTRWDLVVDLRNTVVSRLLRSCNVLIFRGAKPRQHMVEALATMNGMDATEVAPRLWLDDSRLQGIEAEIPSRTPLLALAPGANTEAKRWPSERYAQLAAQLLGPGGILAGGSAILLGAAGEEAAAAPVIAALPPGHAIDLVGRIDPLEAAVWLTRAALYVGNDSGLTHLAAASGIPTLALFGPGLPVRYRPWGRSASYLIAEEDPARTVDLCKIDRERAAAEMRKLSVDQVVLAAERLYRMATA